MDIEITNDIILEQPESFTVSLLKSEGLGNEIHLSPVEAEISIIDDDGMCIILRYSLIHTVMANS